MPEKNLIERLRDNQVQIVKEVKEAAVKSGSKPYLTSEEISGCSVGDLITLELENDSDVKKQIFFGTPLSISEEAPSVPAILAQIPANERWDADLATLKDNYGAGAKMLQLLNRRFNRRPVVVKGITVVTTSEAQRSIAPRKVDVPVNPEDAKLRNEPFKGVYTEFTEYDMVNTVTVLGDFCGLKYEILPRTKIQVNFYIHAIDMISIRS